MSRKCGGCPHTTEAGAIPGNGNQTGGATRPRAKGVPVTPDRRSCKRPKTSARILARPQYRLADGERGHVRLLGAGCEGFRNAARVFGKNRQHSQYPLEHGLMRVYVHQPPRSREWSNDPTRFHPARSVRTTGSTDCRWPCDAALRIDSFEIAHHQQTKINPKPFLPGPPFSSSHRHDLKTIRTFPRSHPRWLFTTRC